MHKHLAALLGMIIKKVFVDDIPSQMKAFDLIGKAYVWEIDLYKEVNSKSNKEG